MPAVTMQHREAWLEIDLDAIRHNVGVIRSLVAPAVVAPVIKANAYGHGVEAVARALDGRVDVMCVATLDEAIELRRLVDARILLLYPVPAAAADDAVRAGVELSVMDPQDLAALAAAASADEPPVELQLCVESGMHRGGLRSADLVAVAEAASADPRFRVAGVWTHLASPEDRGSSAAQVARFEAALRALRDAGVAVPPRHVASSGGIFMHDAPMLDMVRPGLAVYGLLDPGLPIADGAAEAARSLRPAMTLAARAATFSHVEVGDTVGYGDAWTAERPTRVAVLPVGYGDGYLRGVQPGAEALVRGRRHPLVGRVSMDAVTVDVTDEPAAGYDDVFVLLGSQGSETISATDVARARNTIAWEVLSSMAPRLTRVYYPAADTATPD